MGSKNNITFNHFDDFKMNTKTPNSRKMIAQKLLRLRSRIEDWASLNGYENIGSQEIRRDADDNIVWKRNDWEFVDDMYSIVINTTFSWSKERYHQFNELWNYYKIEEQVVNPNLEAEWEQLQQMEWEDN